MQTVTIKGVEIMRPGTWNGVSFALADLEDIVTAFDALKGVMPPRVQLGHDEKQRLARELFADDAAGADGFPALGWPDALRIEGGRLIADLMEVPVKLAKWIERRVYRARSGGLLRGVVANGVTYPWVLDHVALLGDQAPAVPGLADMVLSRDSLVYEAAIGFSYEGADALALAAGDGVADPAELSELDLIMADFDALSERWGALVFGRRGAPAARTLWAEFAGRLKSAARQNLEASDMVDRSKLDLAGMAFDSPEQLAGWLAGLIGVSPGDYGAIADAVAKALGASPAPAADPMEAPADPAAATPLSSEGADMLQLAADRLAAMDARLAETQAALVRVEMARSLEAAERRVDADIAARNLPAALRGTLVELANRPDPSLYQSVLDNARSVPVGERGTGADGVNLAAATLTATDRQFARMNGISEAEFLAAKAAMVAPSNG